MSKFQPFFIKKRSLKMVDALSESFNVQSKNNIIFIRKIGQSKLKSNTYF